MPGHQDLCSLQNLQFEKGKTWNMRMYFSHGRYIDVWNVTIKGGVPIGQMKTRYMSHMSHISDK